MLVTHQTAVNHQAFSDTMTTNDARAMAADLRLTGTRLQNCEINTGKPKYAFNELQLPTLPEELRPPPGTFSGTLQA